MTARPPRPGCGRRPPPPVTAPPQTRARAPRRCLARCRAPFFAAPLPQDRNGYIDAGEVHRVVSSVSHPFFAGGFEAGRGAGAGDL